MMPVTVMAQETNSMVVNLEASYGQTEARTMLDMLNKWRTGSDAWEYAPDGSIIRYNTSAENTLQPLVYDYALEQIAMQRAAEIALNFSHTRPNGTSCNTVIYEEFAANGENIAIGSAGSQNDNVAGTFESWQETNEDYSGQGHRRNMLDSRYESFGIGYAVVNGVHCWVQEFSTSQSATTEIPAFDGEKLVPVEVSDSYTPTSLVSSLDLSVNVEIGKTAILPSADLDIMTSGAFVWFQFIGGIPVEVTPDFNTTNEFVSISDGVVAGLKVGSTTVSTTVYGCTINYTVNVTACTEHTWNNGAVTKEPSCSEEGVMKYTCTSCGETKTEPIDKTEHTVVIDTAVEPTCENTGLTQGSHCSVCGEVIEEQKIVSATGHDYQVIDSDKSEPECGGTLITYQCKNCKNTYQEKVGAGHVWDEEYTIDKAATCTENGSQSRHCSYGCGEVTDVQEIKALGHSFTNYVSKDEPTCTSDGTKIAKCDRCDATDIIIDVGSMVPHHGGMATCIKPATCEGCGKEYGEVDPDNHINTTVVGQVDVTCTKDGYTGETVCIDCGKTIVISVRIPATGHDYKEANRVESQLPCGGEIVTYTCSNCGDTYSESISGQHVWSTEYTIDKEPTCMESGLQSRHCIYDGCTATTDWTYIEPLGHDFENYKSNNDATCEHNGTLTGTCSRCDETDTIVDEGSMLPHKGGTATCTTPATCEQCGNQYGEVDPDNHVDTALVNQKEASCTENGYTGDVICTGCKEVLVAGQVIESNDHQYENGVCIVCGATQSGTVTPIDPEKPDSTQKPDNTNNSNNASNNIVVNNNKDKTSNAVATGDDSQLSMYGSIVIGMIGLGCLIVVYRRKHLMK